MADNELGGDRQANGEAELEDARWAIRYLLLEMARDVLDVAEAKKHSRPYQVGSSELHYRWLKLVAGDLVEKVESQSSTVYRTAVSPYMVKMAQTVQETLDGKDLAEASAEARECWDDTFESVREYAPRAIEEIRRWQSRKFLAASDLEQVLYIFREAGRDLSREEFIRTFEARHTSGPDRAAWQQLSSYLAVDEDEIADLIDRSKRDDS